MSAPDAWAGIHRVCVAQTNAYVREYTPDEARAFADRLNHLAELAEGKRLGRLVQEQLGSVDREIARWPETLKRLEDNGD